MTWTRTAITAAVVEVLEAIDDTVSVFGTPPETFNPPALIVGWPRQVDYATGAPFGIDHATLRVLCAVGYANPDDLDALLDSTRKALDADPSFGGVAQYAAVTTQENWQRLTVAGADVLAADLILDVRM